MLSETTVPAHRAWIIAITLIISLLLSILPLPIWLEDFRPAWASLFLIYWAIMLPKHVGIGSAWIVGLLLDALQGTLLGEYAVLCMFVVLIASKIRQRLRLFPMLKQCMFIFLILGIQYIILMWIQGVSGQPIQGWQHGLHVVTSALIWPVVYFILYWVQTKYQVT